MHGVEVLLVEAYSQYEKYKDVPHENLFLMLWEYRAAYYGLVYSGYETCVSGYSRNKVSKELKYLRNKLAVSKTVISQLETMLENPKNVQTQSNDSVIFPLQELL